jgi:hypothetical protein
MKNTDRPLTLLPRRSTRRHTQKRTSNLWVEAINQTLSDRGHDGRLISITTSLWDRHLEPLIAALEEGALAKLHKRKRLGYQVVDPTAGEMPDGWVSFGIYSLADCRRVINEDKDRWQLVTIFEGDIEEPTFMKGIR